MNEELAELFSRCFDMEFIGLRYFNVYGPRQDPEGPYAAVLPRFFKASLAGKAPVIFGDGGQSRDFTFVSDAVAANLLAAGAPQEACGRAYNVAGGRRTTVNELASAVREAVGGAPEPNYEADRPGDVRHSFADGSLSRRALGYAPKVSLEEGIAIARRHYEVTAENTSARAEWRDAIRSGERCARAREGRDRKFRSIIIQPIRGWTSLQLKEVWAYRELLYFLVWRDVKVRYKQTALGVAWVVLQPLMTMIVFTIFFGRLADVGSDGLPYPIFSFAGLLPWNLFAQGLSQSAASLVGSSNLINKVYFPRLVIPTSAVLVGLVDFCVTFVMLFGFMAYYRVWPTPPLSSCCPSSCCWPRAQRWGSDCGCRR